MAEIIKGNEIAKTILTHIKDEVSKMDRKPTLAVILVGDNFASKSYVRGKKRAGKKVDVNVEVYEYKEDVLEKEIIEKINHLNNDINTDGIIVQLPLPKHLNESKIINTVSSKKDVDGFTFNNAGRLFKGKPQLVPCTPKGIIYMLKAIKVDLEGKYCVVVGRSNLVGLPLSRMLIEENATVTVCHSKTKELKKMTNQADILIVAIGQNKFITKDFVKEGAVVIDVGINRDENNKLSGDVDFDNVQEKASYISPVPKGVGPLTIAMLLLNTLIAKKGDIYE